MIKKLIHILVGFSAVLGLGLSIFLACRLLPNTGELGFDYQAIIVTLMAALFTLVVGWNIYTGLEYKSYGARYEELARKIEEEAERQRKDVEHNIGIIRGNEAHLLATMFAANDKAIQKYSMMVHLIASLIRLDIEKDVDTANNYISAVIVALENSEDIKIPQASIAKILLKAGQIKHCEMLKDFDDLIALIQSSAAKA